MQIRKSYKEINPNLLYDEIREYVQHLGMTPDQNKLETYSVPSDSSRFIYRGTLTFRVQDKEGLRASIIGTDKGETRLMLDSSDEIFSTQKMNALADDLNFMLGAYESPE